MPKQRYAGARSRMEGAAELSAALAALGAEVATKIGRQAVRASAVELRDELVEGAPLGPGGKKYWRLKNGDVRSRDYGHLRDNIRVRAVRSRKQNHIVYEVTTGRAFWGTFLEFGTVSMRPHPWFRPILDRLHNRLFDVQADLLRTGIEKAAKRLARRSRAVLPNGRNG